MMSSSIIQPPADREISDGTNRYGSPKTRVTNKRVLTPVVVCGSPCILPQANDNPILSPLLTAAAAAAAAAATNGSNCRLSGPTMLPQNSVPASESEKLTGLNQYVLRELKAARPQAPDIEATSCPAPVEPFRKAWWAGVRPATCERTCRHRSKVCDAIQLCNDCTGYYCKWLADLVGIPVLKASGRVDPLVFHTDPLAKLYWDRISKVVCCPKSTNKCLMCIRRYQLFTHFLPGNLLFRGLVHQSVMKLNEEGFAVDMGLIRKVTRRHLERITETMELRLPSEYYASLQAYEIILRRGPLVDVLANGLTSSLTGSNHTMNALTNHTQGRNDGLSQSSTISLKLSPGSPNRESSRTPTIQHFPIIVSPCQTGVKDNSPLLTQAFLGHTHINGLKPDCSQTKGLVSYHHSKNVWLKYKNNQVLSDCLMDGVDTTTHSDSTVSNIAVSSEAGSINEHEGETVTKSIEEQSINTNVDTSLVLPTFLSTSPEPLLNSSIKTEPSLIHLKETEFETTTTTTNTTTTTTTVAFNPEISGTSVHPVSSSSSSSYDVLCGHTIHSNDTIEQPLCKRRLRLRDTIKRPAYKGDSAIYYGDLEGDSDIFSLLDEDELSKTTVAQAHHPIDDDTEGSDDLLDTTNTIGGKRKRRRPTISRKKCEKNDTHRIDHTITSHQTRVPENDFDLQFQQHINTRDLNEFASNFNELIHQFPSSQTRDTIELLDGNKTEETPRYSEHDYPCHSLKKEHSKQRHGLLHQTRMWLPSDTHLCSNHPSPSPVPPPPSHSIEDTMILPNESQGRRHHSSSKLITKQSTDSQRYDPHLSHMETTVTPPEILDQVASAFFSRLATTQTVEQPSFKFEAISEIMNDELHTKQLEEELRLANDGVRGVFWDPAKEAWCTLLCLSPTSHSDSSFVKQTRGLGGVYSSIKRKILCFRVRWGSLASAKWNAVYERLKSNPPELKYVSLDVRQELAGWVKANIDCRDWIHPSSTIQENKETHDTHSLLTSPTEINDSKRLQTDIKPEIQSIIEEEEQQQQRNLNKQHTIERYHNKTQEFEMSPLTKYSVTNEQITNSPPARLVDLLGSLARALGTQDTQSSIYNGVEDILSHDICHSDSKRDNFVLKETCDIEGIESHINEPTTIDTSINSEPNSSKFSGVAGLLATLHSKLMQQHHQKNDDITVNSSVIPMSLLHDFINTSQDN